MALRIYNTLARALQEFQPLTPGQVRMYVCGMTVYDFCHIGHARSMVAFDVVQRWLKQSGLQVHYVRNITDIDDKIIRRATENGETIRVLTDRMIAAHAGIGDWRQAEWLRRDHPWKFSRAARDAIRVCAEVVIQLLRAVARQPQLRRFKLERQLVAEGAIQAEVRPFAAPEQIQ